MSVLLSQPFKRKRATYGKAIRPPFREVDNDFDALDDLPLADHASLPGQNHLRTPTKRAVSKSRTIEKTDSELGEFDIPSSDGENAPKATVPKVTGRLRKVTVAEKPEEGVVRTHLARSRGPSEDRLYPTKRQRIHGNAQLEAYSETSSRARGSFDLDYRSRTPPCSTSSHLTVEQITVVDEEEKPRRTELQTSGLSRQRSVLAGERIPSKRHISTGKQTKKEASRSIGNNAVKDSRPNTKGSDSGIRTQLIRGSLKAVERQHYSTQSFPKVLSPVLDRPPSTPPRSTGPSPTDSPSRIASTTPRQTSLWSNLLSPEEPMYRTPSEKFMKLSLQSSLVNDETIDVSANSTPKRRKLVEIMESNDSETDASDDSGTDESAITDADVANPTPPSNPDFDLHVVGPTDGNPPRSSQTTTNGPRVTYGGQRSYLQDSESLDDLLTQPLELESSPAATTVSAIKPLKRFTAAKRDAYDISDDEDGGKAVKSIYELRAAGNSRNSNNISQDVNSLVDEMNNVNRGGLTGQRNAMLELCKKLTEPTFRSRFIQGGHEHQVFQPLSDSTDEILLLTIASAIVLLLVPGTDVANAQQLYRAEVMPLLVKSLHNRSGLTEIVKHRHTNMSKSGQVAVTDLQTKLLRLKIWQPCRLQELSPRLLSLKAVELLIRKLRESGDIGEAVIYKELLSELQTIIIDVLNLSNKRLVQPHIFYLETALSAIESSSLAPACVSNESIWNKTSLRSFANSLGSVMEMTTPSEQSVELLVLRIAVNLANGNERNAEGLAQSSLVLQILSRISHSLDRRHSGTAGEIAHLDRLLLALGALINLAECSARVRSIVLTQGIEHVDILVDAFVANREKSAQADSLEASEANVAFGYLAILFGNLCLSPALKEHVASRLPNKKLGLVTSAVEEFIMHHQETDKRVEDNEAYALFTEKLRAVAENLRRVDV